MLRFTTGVTSRKNKYAIGKEVLNISKPVDVIDFKNNGESIHLTDTVDPEQTLYVIVGLDKDKVILQYRAFIL